MSERTRLDNSLLVRALVEFSGRSVDQVKQFLDGKSKRDRLALSNSPRVSPIYDRLESESMSAVRVTIHNESHERNGYGGNQYAAAIIAVLSPYGAEGLPRQHAIELVEQERRRKGLKIPRTLDETIQHSFESYCLQSQVFLKRSTPCEALFRSRLVKNAAYWSVDREAAARWLKRKRLPLPWK